jgi:hypothetical protein
LKVATVLYTSTEIHSKIKSLLGPSAGGRRVAIVAYVGPGALAYIIGHGAGHYILGSPDSSG